MMLFNNVIIYPADINNIKKAKTGNKKNVFA